MTAAQDAIDTFTKQWYNGVTKGLDLSPKNFQLSQGSLSLGHDSTLLWDCFDSIPPKSINQLFQPSGTSRFSSTYSAVINNLYPQTGDVEQKALGDKYIAWVNFKKDAANTPKDLDWSKPDAAQQAALAIFNKFAFANGLSQAQTNAMRTALTQTDLVTTAQILVNAAGKKYAYTANQNGLKEAIDGGKANKSVAFNSKTQTTDLRDAWAKASASGHYSFVSASASTEWDQFISKVASSGFDINVTFAKVATLLGNPYGLDSPFSTDLQDFKPWYNSSALNMAYKNNNNKVWQHVSPTWEETFGPKGSLRRRTTALIVVDGATSEVTSSASMASNDRQKFSAQAKLGVWPWFQASGSGGWENQVTKNDDSGFTVKSTTKEGNPSVLGFLVSDLASLFT